MTAGAEVRSAESRPGRNSSGRIVYLALTISAFFWGAGFSVSRFALRTVSPVEFLAGASFFAAVTQIMWTAIRGNWRDLKLPPRLLWAMLALGLLSQNVLNGLTYLGLASTTATNAALIYGFSPVLIGLLAAIFLHESFGGQKVLGAIVGFGGVALIITQGRFETVQIHGMLAGNLWVLAAASYWAAYAIFTRLITQRVTPQAFTFFILVPGALLPVAWVWVRENRFCLAGINLPTLLAMAFSGPCTATMGMNFWNWGLAHIEASRVGMFSYLEPVFAAAVAMIFLGERLTWPTIAGSALVFAGILLSTRSWGTQRQA
ncbi:MAG TPA: DMT family transporter [Terriglobia bacterium]|nr:DMT family transporter [Terriglobia bacterium]